MTYLTLFKSPLNDEFGDGLELKSNGCSPATGVVVSLGGSAGLEDPVVAVVDVVLVAAASANSAAVFVSSFKAVGLADATAAVVSVADKDDVPVSVVSEVVVVVVVVIDVGVDVEFVSDCCC